MDCAVCSSSRTNVFNNSNNYNMMAAGSWTVSLSLLVILRTAPLKQKTASRSFSKKVIKYRYYLAFVRERDRRSERERES
jgi:hypothetical protein